MLPRSQLAGPASRGEGPQASASTVSLPLCSSHYFRVQVHAFPRLPDGLQCSVVLHAQPLPGTSSPTRPPAPARFRTRLPTLGHNVLVRMNTKSCRCRSRHSIHNASVRCAHAPASASKVALISLARMRSNRDSTLPRTLTIWQDMAGYGQQAAHEQATLVAASSASIYMANKQHTSTSHSSRPAALAAQR